MIDRKTITQVLSYTVAFLIIFIIGCEGPEGPEGPAGLQGEQGEQGEQGIPGLDGTNAAENCTNCHYDDTDVLAAKLQWENSKHATGGAFERNSTSCAPCHTSEGFTEILSTGADETVAAISNPTPPNCRTCHQIHTNFDSTDFALATTAPVVMYADSNITIDLGKGNLCIKCHQSRPATIPSTTPAATDSINITSTRYGPHHGTQGPMLAGVGGWEVVGSVSYQNTMHTTLVTEGCPTCHMAEAYGAQAGGHTMSMEYEYHGGDVVNDAGCESCHDDAEADVTSAKAEIQTALDELKTLLVAQGVMTESGSAVTGMTVAKQAGALFNYKFVSEDLSMGSHNKKYALALLANAKEAIE